MGWSEIVTLIGFYAQWFSSSTSFSLNTACLILTALRLLVRDATCALWFYLLIHEVFLTHNQLIPNSWSNLISLQLWPCHFPAQYRPVVHHHLQNNQPSYATSSCFYSWHPIHFGMFDFAQIPQLAPQQAGDGGISVLLLLSSHFRTKTSMSMLLCLTNLSPKSREGAYNWLSLVNP